MQKSVEKRVKMWQKRKLASFIKSFFLLFLVILCILRNNPEENFYSTRDKNRKEGKAEEEKAKLVLIDPRHNFSWSYENMLSEKEIMLTERVTQRVIME